MFFCAISGEVPQDGVVSSKSGHVYERRLILKYIAENGTDPITGEKLVEGDLISIKASPKTATPRPPTLTSIPAILHTLQNEWDALVLETFSLKQQYNAARQELSHALYQHDAATRVVARLIKERDAAREALASVQASMGVTPAPSAPADVEMSAAEEAPSGVLPAPVATLMEETQKSLIASRKKRKPPPGYVTVAELKSFTSKDTISSLHSPSPAGVTAFSLSRSESSRFVSGGNDKIVQVYDRSAGKVLVSLKGHTKKVNFVDWREKEGETTLIMSGSADKTSRIWAQDPGSGDYAPTHTIKTHKGEITGLALHPTATILGLSSLDKTYSLHDLSTFQSIYHSPASDTPYTSLAIHPDGLLLGLGSSSSTLQIYDIRAGTIAASLTPADASPFTVNTFSFSENGYNLAAPDSKSSVAIWDLRKLSTVHSIKLEESFNIHKIRYDYSAQYIGIAGTGVRVFQQKTWEELLRVDEAKEVTDLAFGANGQEILFATGREVKTWASKDA